MTRPAKYLANCNCHSEVVAMPYTINQIKVFAYNNDEQPDFTIFDRDLYLGLAYCYEWWRMHPEDKVNCEKLMEHYIQHYHLMKPVEYKFTNSGQ